MIVHSLTRQDIHGRGPNELGHEQITRMVKQFQRGTNLLNDAVTHDHDAVGHGHGFNLVVRDVNGSGAQALVQLFDFTAHGNAQFGI